MGANWRIAKRLIEISFESFLQSDLKKYFIFGVVSSGGASSRSFLLKLKIFDIKLLFPSGLSGEEFKRFIIKLLSDILFCLSIP